MIYLLRKIYNKLRYDYPRLIKNVWVYRESLMRTYTWDYSGSLYYLRTHLEQMEPVIRNGNHLYGERTANNIKVCKLLLDRILDCDDQYMFDHLDIEFKKNGGIKIHRTPKYSEAPRESKLQRKILNQKEQQDWDLLCKMLHKHQRGFWD